MFRPSWKFNPDLWSTALTFGRVAWIAGQNYINFFQPNSLEYFVFQCEENEYSDP